MQKVLWWFGFTFCGIWLQNFFPGVDFLAPGLVLCLHYHLYTVGSWLVVLWILVQEGTGSMAFGYSVLWYLGIVAIYLILQIYLEAENIFFIILLALFMGFWHYFLTRFMANLQDLVFSNSPVIKESLYQVLFFPFVWISSYTLFNRWFGDERI